jgi:hypothetical protein
MVGYTNITADRATEILNKNTFNRPLRQGIVDKYARDMKEGRWLKNGSTIVLTTDGTLLDGQHRLFAVIEAAECQVDFSVPMIVVRDADRSSLATIDTGLPRTYADYKKLEAGGTGHVFPYASVVSSVCRLVYWYENQWPKLQVHKTRVSHQELDDILEEHPQIPELTADVAGSDKVRRLGGQSVTAFVYAIGAEKYPNEARAWLEILRTGEAAKSHPAIVLREQLIAKALANKIVDQPTRLVWTIKSWNAFAQGSDIGRIRWAIDEPMPAIYGTKHYTGKLAGQSAIKKMVKAAEHDPKVRAAIAGKIGVRRRPKKRAS